MLICGGEVHRVEDSLKRIFNAYGVMRADIFIITSSMVITVHSDSGKPYTQTRRIGETAADYEKLHQLNELSRSICARKFSYEELCSALSEIRNGKTYPAWLKFFCAAFISGIFTLFFGGGIIEGVVCFGMGAMVRLIVLACGMKIRNKIFIKFISSLSATLIAHIMLYIGVIPTVDNVIIGSIMTLLPGIGLTTALKDLLVGDSIAGLLRTIEACIAALAIAAGYFAITAITGGIGI